MSKMLDGWVMGTPLTVMNTRCMKSESFRLNITFPCGLSLLSLLWQGLSTLFEFSKVSMLSKICLVFRKITAIFSLRQYQYKKIFGLKSYPNTITKNIRFWESHPNATGMRILVFGLKYSKNIWILNYSLNSVWGKLRLSGASWVINDSWGWNHLTMLRMSDTK